MPDVREITDGWDSRAYLVDGTWLEREPRRPEVRARLLAETRLLPWLAAQLPLPVPLPSVVRADPLRVRHLFLPGQPASRLTAAQGAVLGGFFRALHSADLTAAAGTGVTDERTARREHLRMLDRFRDEVVRLLPRDLRSVAGGLLDRLARPTPAPALVHGDVGPAHLLVLDGAVSGVIDWSDAHIGDPAIDLAWLVHGSGAGAAVSRAYAADTELLARAHDWHLLGPWHEVTYGLDTDRPDLVRSGTTGICSRLKSR